MLLRSLRRASAWDFSPADLNDLLVYVDAEASVITHTGGLVDSIAGVDGTEFELTATGGERPTTGAASSPTGLNLLTFDGARRLVNTEFTVSNPNLTIIAVASLNDEIDDAHADTLVDSYASQRFHLYRGKADDHPSTGGAPHWVFGTDGGDCALWAFPALSDEQLSIITALRSTGFPNETRVYRRPGASSIGGGDPGSGTFNGLSVGQRRDSHADYGLRGNLAALLIYGYRLGAADLENVWHYLRLRWGVLGGS